jgi:hypothetical protein
MHNWKDEATHIEMRIFAFRLEASFPSTLENPARKMAAPQNTTQSK